MHTQSRVPKMIIVDGIHDCMVAILGALVLLGNYWVRY